MDKAGESGIDNGIITKWIERYYEEKLDKRDKQRCPALNSKRFPKALLDQMLYLN